MSHELIHEAQELEKYTAELEEHIKFLESQIQELDQFAERLTILNLNFINNCFNSSIGKGVYLPAELKDNNLLVEVGAGVIVKKTPLELKDVVIEQISKLQESKISLISQIGFYAQKIQEIMSEVQNQKGISQ